MSTKIKNIRDMRDSLIDNYESVEIKEMGLAEGTVLANIAGKIIASAKTQMEYNKYVGSKEPIEFLIGT